MSGADAIPPPPTSGSFSLPSATGPAADLKLRITDALNTIDRIKNDPQLSKRITDTIGTVLSPLIQPIANIKHGLLDSVTTYRKVQIDPTGKKNPGKKAPAGGGTGTLKRVKPGKITPIAPKQTQMIQETIPSALDRALALLSNIDTNLASIDMINANVSTINTNLSALLDLSKAGTPAATNDTNTTTNNTTNTTNNSQEGGRRQTKGRRRTRR